MTDQPQKSSNTTIAIIVLTLILAVGIGFLVLNNRQSDPAADDLDLNLSGSQLSNNSLGDSLNDELGSSVQDSLSGESQTDQANNHTTNNSDQPINNQLETPPMTDKTNMPQPSMIIDQNKQYLATMTTNMGTIKIELFTRETPKTVNNFVYLAQNNFYDGLIFHRVISDFMIQGGCPLGNGMGGPGYKFEDEQNSAPLVEGSLAMANSGPNTNGSQFFIVTAEATPWLDGLHTHFGRVVEGLEVVKSIEQTPTGANDKPAQDIVIQSVVISEN